jgi:hypothetical protein
VRACNNLYFEFWYIIVIYSWQQLKDVAMCVRYHVGKKEEAHKEMGQEIMSKNAINLYGEDERLGSTGLYLCTLYLGIVALIIGIFLLYSFSFEGTYYSAGRIISLIGFISILIANIYSLVLLYRLWKFTIAESKMNELKPSIETPGKAIGYLFIPFFDLYWIFIAFGKLPKNLNAIANAKGIKEMMSESIGTVLAVLVILSIIPVIGYLTALIAAWIILPVFYWNAINFCEKIYKANSE